MAGFGKLVLLMSPVALVAAQPEAPIPALPPTTFEIVNDTGRAIGRLRWDFAGGDRPAHGEQGALAAGATLRLDAPPQDGCRFALFIRFADGGRKEAEYDRCGSGPIPISRGRSLARAAMDVEGESSEPIPPPPPPPPPPSPPPPPMPMPPAIAMSPAAPRLRMHIAQRTMAAPPAPIVAAAPPAEAPPAPAAAATPYCDILQDEASVADCAYYRDVLAHLKQGKAGLRAPPSMRVGETAEVSLALTRDEQGTTVDAALGAEPTQRFTAKMTRRMAAELGGTGFAVAPAGSIEQDLGIGDAVRWTWKVTAQPGPTHELVATIYAVVRPPGPVQPGAEATRQLIATRRQHVAVSVPFVQRSEGWMDATSEWLGHLNKLQAALGALASGALATWLIAWWRKRRSAGKPPA